MSDIVELENARLADAVNHDLVAELERMTEEARRGEIVAMAYAVVGGGDDLRTGWDGLAHTGFRLGAAVLCLQARYADYLMERGA
ncbi:hypothetical protein [Rhodosalinus sediminis]|mgnify:FL=1|uniref:hypothetical protein n=1 Tax=Rhodosalinus sediminis TaxID=1940533 RepID=UPI002355BDA9|nr:hypothetical protein [Rhodosalinus sediminis]